MSQFTTDEAQAKLADAMDPSNNYSYDDFMDEYGLIPTGLFFDLPENFEMQIRPRSGLAAKKGVTVLNSPGTIDSDYTGEIKVILINHGKETFIVTKGDRIAQAVISTVTAKNIINLNKVKSIDKETDRGSGGFGSTGVK